jgi:hypothetical protein
VTIATCLLVLPVLPVPYLELFIRLLRYVLHIVSKNTDSKILDSYTLAINLRKPDMPEICTDINQTEQIRFWVSELTDFKPHEVDSVLKVLKAKKPLLSQPIAS